MTKKLILLFILSFGILKSFAQLNFQKYYTKENEEIADKEKAYYTRIINVSLDNPPSIQVEELFLDGNKLKLKGTAIDKDANKFIGKKYELYENGNLKSETSYSNEGLQIDTAFYYYENGNLKSVKYYPFKIDKKISIQSKSLFFYII